MKKQLTYLALLISFAPQLATAQSVGDITDLILVTGQSNVRASQTQYDPSLDSVDVRVFAYTNSTDWKVADLHQVWDVDGWHPGNGSLQDPSRLPYNSFPFHFAKTVVENDPSRVVGFVVASAPGEGILHWDAGSEFSQTLEAHVLAALNAHGVKAEVDGILWHQGETDWQYNGTSDPDATAAEKSYSSYYPEKLDSLIQRFRNQSWFGPNKPFICGETKQAPVNDRLMALNTDADPWTGCVAGSDLTTKEMDLTTNPPKLGTHFDAISLRVLGKRYGLKYLQMTSESTDAEPPIIKIDQPTLQMKTSGPITISGTATDSGSIVKNRLLIKNTTTGKYWNGSSWTNTWSWFQPNGTENWSYGIILPAGNFATIAWAWDSENNRGRSTTSTFSIASNDTTLPVVVIRTSNTDQLPSDTLTISGTAADNGPITRIQLLIRNTTTGQYWDGSSWTNTWAWFKPNGAENWTYGFTAPTGNFAVIAWAWDSANNRGKSATYRFSHSAP